MLGQHVWSEFGPTLLVSCYSVGDGPHARPRAIRDGDLSFGGAHRDAAGHVSHHRHCREWSIRWERQRKHYGSNGSAAYGQLVYPDFDLRAGPDGFYDRYGYERHCSSFRRLSRIHIDEGERQKLEREVHDGFDRQGNLELHFKKERSRRFVLGCEPNTGGQQQYCRLDGPINMPKEKRAVDRSIHRPLKSCLFSLL